MSDMTPERLANLEKWAAVEPVGGARFPSMEAATVWSTAPELCAALRKAWAERDAAREVLGFIEARAGAVLYSRGGLCLCHRSGHGSPSASQHADQALEAIAALARSAFPQNEESEGE